MLISCKSAAGISAVLYLALIAFCGLWPFSFIPLCMNTAVDRLPDTDGVRISPCSVLSTVAPLRMLHKRFRRAKGFTLETVLKTAGNDQSGPARIVSWSADESRRNFTLGQEKDRLVFRLRTTDTDLNGTPCLYAPGIFTPGKSQHITLTYDGQKVQLYLDGNPAVTHLLTGRFVNWSRRYFLMAGNERIGTRPWNGELYRIALYNRALSSNEVRQCFARYGTGEEARPEVPGLVGLYRFDDAPEENVIHDRSAAGLCGDLVSVRLPVRRMKTCAESYFSVRDFMINITGFIPLAFILYYNLPEKRRRQPLAIYLLPLVTGFGLSLAVEISQRYTLWRHPSELDIIYNVAGSTIGTIFLAIYLAVMRKKSEGR